MAYDTHLADRIRTVLNRQGGCEEKKMFGGICFMIGGNMCCGVLKTDLMLRLTNDLARESLKKPHTRPMDFTGRPMPKMIYVDAMGTDTDEALEYWVKLAAAQTKSLPPKKAKAAS